jgi:hypothetical protein
MASVTLTQSRTSGNNATTYNFNTAGGTAMGIGTNGGADIIYFTMGARSVASLTDVTSVTVDGVAAGVVDVEVFDEGGGIRSLAAIFALARNSLPDPTQTDVDVTIVFNQACVRAALDVFVSPDAGATAFDITASSVGAGATITLSVDTPSGGAGIVIGIVYSGTTGSVTWTGLTEATDVDVGAEGSNQWTTALASNAAAATPMTVSAANSTVVLGAGIAASFDVAADDFVPFPDRGSGGMGGMTGGMN